MDYIKIKFEVRSPSNWQTDVLMSEMGKIGFDSFEETDYGFDAYIPAKNYNETYLIEFLSHQPDDISITWHQEFIPDQNWNSEWEKNYFKPLVIADKCLVRAPFHSDYPSCQYEIIIEPNMAFGTGNHETTTMMLEAILQEDMEGKWVLDMGCGTGILGILASMKGAEKIMAIDIDEWPVKGTAENASLNRIHNLTVRQGNARSLGEDTYDIILANIHKNVLIDDMPAYLAVLHKGGKLYLSGFYLADLPDITNAALSIGLKSVYHTVKNNWVMACFQY